MKKMAMFILIATISIQSQAETCSYPADPINWILRYCALDAETDDEVAIQESSCFKSSEKDLRRKDKCAVNAKYKNQICEKFLKKSKRYKSIADCLKDSEVKPFFAGE